MLALLVALACGSGAPALAQEIDIGASAISDTVFAAEDQPGPSYQTVYDRDGRRSNWMQTLSYFHSTRRLAFSGSGNMTAQDLFGAANKSTFGDFFGHLDGRVTRKWIVSLDGRFAMNSTADATRKTADRRNRLQIRSQYNVTPVRAMNLTGAIFTEFQQDHERSHQTLLKEADPINDPGSVDTLKVQRDSSYTSARQDGVSGYATWRMKSWLNFNGSGAASRRRPFQRSLIRDFENPLDSSGGGTVLETRPVTHEPSDNAQLTSNITFTKIPGGKLILGSQISSIHQSRFDHGLRGQENVTLNRNATTAHVEYGPRFNTFLTVDASLARSLQEYRLRKTSSSLVTTRQMSTTISRSETGSQAGLTFLLSRARHERQQNQNGIVIDRSLLANASRRVSRRLSLEALGSVNLHSTRYVISGGDQDIVRSGGAVGGGYLLTPSCSTTVRFSVNRSHNVFLDASTSASNNTQSIYQMTSTLLFTPSRNFTIRQFYLLSADYKIFDFEEGERQNFLNRVRRIDTDFVDSLFSFAFVRLTHSFIYRDNGGYYRDPGAPERAYRVTIETYEQTLNATVGIDVAAGVRLVATQGLFNQRNYDLRQNSSTVRNRFSLTAGIEVNRTLPGGSQITGALRHIGGYDEKVTPNMLSREEDYWIAGATFQKGF